MRKTYKSSNVRFCMEDENQCRTWEYLQSLTRKDSSYGKALSDAFVLVLDGKVPKGGCRRSRGALLLPIECKESFERRKYSKRQDAFGGGFL